MIERANKNSQQLITKNNQYHGWKIENHIMRQVFRPRAWLYVRTESA